MEYPRISIVTPSYNQAKYLPETIESILRQDYPNLEYIIVDGGSRDGSVDVIRRYERHLAWWVSEKDSGQSEAINKGFAKSTGELFNWINSDDLLFPGALHRLAEAFRNHPDTAMVVGDHARGDAEGRVVRIRAVPSRMAVSADSWVSAGGQQSTFIASRVFRQVGGVRQDLHYIMDRELYHRILAAGGRFVPARGLIGMIREHPECKGLAHLGEWRHEIDRMYRHYEVSEKRQRLAVARMRLCRLLDGSYVRSRLLYRKWRGKQPWNGTAH